ncbi:hypothetical protein J4429_05215 [Candidatus Pacearchaeota archaeon]|uniref:R15P Isomerase n=1 Tax=uncultured Candidatus Pacearchaeota archaeon TaxID=2109283 RepID=A0A447IU81_9ARCH|nr:hypothetical protein [Candidatus Pacearchaeota archaeon]VDS11062.1 R15P Isomerase [uncultured Candidatus Pacearchaeota archaeon]VDS11084.1 R15P Isomerase [uncultured Candidatus Pacearchaeota archaeon]VDS11096.1 R15P Isomerase [uncultured Candidatus Pacearchaeota archaeon]VDS11103.1 R15P Isomerase [uncultured Candidatus Pacearchaeota archaeon]
MGKKEEFNKICKDIKFIRIQGAENIAKAGFKAYKLFPTKSSKNKLLKLRPTEPMLENVLKLTDKFSYNQLIEKLNENQNIINKNLNKLIKNNMVIFTHCHSSTLSRALIFAKKQGKNFEVYNTETRPLFQGRKTAKELRKANIKVTMFVDSAIKIALTKEQDREEKTRPVDIIMLGADAITKKGVANKIGSGIVAEIAKPNKIPLYIISDSLKFTKKSVKLEQRSQDEIWNNKKIRIENPAFEFIPKDDITGIVSELGILKYNEFLKKIKRK